MTADFIERSFAKMGARVKFGEAISERGVSRRELLLDVRIDKRGEYFFIRRQEPSRMELIVLDVQPRDRHLLLLSRNGQDKHRFLLGHDERHWFVAGIPEIAPVSRVQDAKQALKPEAVLTREHCLRSKYRDRRTNAARVRQGEWFFVPAVALQVDNWLVLRNEPLVRGRGSKPHTCEELYRFGGETVYVSPGAPNGLTEGQYQALSPQERQRWSWRVMKRNPKVYVRGRVRHSDHATIALDGWHEVFMNTESLSQAMSDVVFLD
ncbi:MAG: hypothetical protein WCB11_22780 [Terriglobales bacterium]